MAGRLSRGHSPYEMSKVTIVLAWTAQFLYLPRSSLHRWGKNDYAAYQHLCWLSSFIVVTYFDVNHPLTTVTGSIKYAH
jgi:hypothetical protein